eukprot:22786-Pleurochrysis_carterae.AAC.2
MSFATSLELASSSLTRSFAAVALAAAFSMRSADLSAAATAAVASARRARSSAAAAAALASPIVSVSAAMSRVAVRRSRSRPKSSSNAFCRHAPTAARAASAEAAASGPRLSPRHGDALGRSPLSAPCVLVRAGELHTSSCITSSCDMDSSLRPSSSFSATSAANRSRNDASPSPPASQSLPVTPASLAASSLGNAPCSLASARSRARSCAQLAMYDRSCLLTRLSSANA